MVVPAPHTNGVSLERTQTRRRLAGVRDACPATGGDGVDERARLRRDTTEALHEVESDTFTHQDGPSAPTHGPQPSTDLRSLTLGDVCLDDHGRIEERKHARKDRSATSHHRLARDGMRGGTCVCRNACFCRYVAGREVFLEG